MKNFFTQVAKEKTKHALVAVSFMALAIFVVAPLLPQVDSTLDAIAIRAGLTAAYGGDAGGTGSDGGTDSGGCCGDSGSTGGSTDPGTDQNPPPPPPPPPEPRCTLSASPSNLPYGGGNTTLSWTTDDATYVSINQGIGRVANDSSRTVSVTATKTFTLTAQGEGGTVTCDTTVTVAPPAAPSCTISANPNNLPYGGGNTTLTWTSQNATAASINQYVGSVAVNGSKTVSTQTAKTYTLTVTGPGGTATCDAPVTVAQPSAPSCTLTVSPKNFPYGGGTALFTWTTDNATSVSIDGGVGSVALDGTRNVAVSASKSYTLTATGPGGTVQCTDVVTVASPSAPSCTISANPNNLPYGGGNTTLTWTSQNATAASINQYVGSVAVNGSKTVSTQTAKTYTLTVTGPGGTATCDAPVTISQPSAPSCSLSATPTNLPYGGGNVTLTWTSQNATAASINHYVGPVQVNGSKTVSTQTAKTYTLTVTGPGGTATCDAPVTIAAPNAPVCTLSANPNNLPYGGGNTTLTWTTDNATSVSIDQGIGGVSLDGSKNVVVTTAKTFKLTATGPGGSVTCEAPVTIAAPSAPTCALTGSPANLPYGGGNSVLTWTTDNATNVTFNQGIGTVSLDGSKNVFVNTTKDFVLTATGPGGTVTCNMIIVVAPQELPSCSVSASPNNFPYGGGTTVLTWSTPRADTVTIDQGVGSVSKDGGSKNVFVGNTKTFTVTATNSAGSVTCNAPVTVGNPAQPTCALTVDPSEINAGEYSRVEWSSTNVTNVTIKKIIAGVESPFQNTSAGAGSVIVSPNAQTTYKGTFTGPGGSVQCEATLVIKTPNAPTCAISASPNSFPYGGGNTLLTWSSENATQASIDQNIGSVSPNGNRTVAITAGKTFKLTVTGPGGTNTCEAPIVVGAPGAPSCTISANPNNLPYGGGNTTLTWTSQNATGASINQNVGTVSLSGTKDVSLQTAKTYTLTVTGPGGTATCDAPVTISAPQEPACSLTASPNTHPFGGGNSVLTWTTDNATSVSINEGVGPVSLDGSKNVVVPVSKTYTLTATGPGGTKTCTASITVAPQALPSCSFTASPNNFPYGGGTTQLTWSTQNADTVSIDQGVGTVSKNGVTNASVQTTKTFTLTATNQTGSVTCTTPVSVGNPAQPTCALTVDPTEILAGNNARVEWSSTNVTSVNIKKVIEGVESNFQETTAGAGSVIVSPNATTTYKGTFTGPGGSVQCQATLKVNAPQKPLSCDAFSISPSTVDDNDDATMSWSTSNAEHVTINNGIGSVAVDGSRTIRVTDDETYTLTAIRGTEQVTCTASVRVDDDHGGGGSPSPRCELFKASDTRIKEGETVDLRWETRRGTKLEIEPNIFETSDDDEVDEGEVTVKPKKDTKYTLTVWKGSKKDTCTVKVNVEDNFMVLSARDQLPLTSISFTDIPYTGFDAGPFLTGVFYTLLALWSLAIAYVVVVRRGLGGTAPAHGGGSMIPSHEYESHTTHAHRAHTDTAVHHEPEIFATPHHEAAVAHATPAPAASPVHVTHASFAPANLPTAAMPVYASAAAHAVDEDEFADDEEEVAEDDDMAALEKVAHAHNVLLSSDAIRMIIDQYDARTEQERLLSDIIERAKASYPREDGWIVLNRERVVALFKEGQTKTPTGEQVAQSVGEVAAPVVETRGAATLAEAIVTGNTALAYQMLGEVPLLAIADAAEELDSVVRSRANKSVVANDMLIRAAAHVTDEKLKAAVAALVTAIDGTYSDEVAAVRLAVIKALKAVS